MAAARDLLLEGGLEGLSMRKVAARCGLTATAIYRHFPDKDALLASTIDEAFGLFISYLSRALREREPLARLRAMGSQYFEFGREHHRYYRLIFMTDCSALGFDKLDAATRSRAASSFQMLVDRVAECQHSGDIQTGNARAQAVFVWSTLHGLLSLHLTGNLSVPEAQLEGLFAQQVDATVSALKSNWHDPAS
jgi:AcrR family transcriptional regulator